MSLGKISIAIEAAMASFESDMGRAARIMERDTKKMERDALRLESQVKAVGKAMGLAIAAGVSAAAVSIKRTIDSMDELSKSAQKVGLPTEEFSRLTYAASLADVSMENLQGSLGKLIKSQAAAMDASSQQAKMFDALGISITETVDGIVRLRSADDVLRDFADRFKELGGGSEAIAAGMAIFGRGFQNIIPLIKDGGDAIRDSGDELERFGGLLTTEAGESAELFNDNLTRLKTAADALWRQVAADLLPDLVRLTEQFLALVREGDQVGSAAHSIADGFRIIGSVAESSITLISGVTNVLRGLAGQAQGFLEILNGIQQGDFSQIKQGTATYKQGSALSGQGLDRLVNPRGPNALFKDEKKKPYRAYDGPLLAPSATMEAAQLQEQAAAIRSARERQKKLAALLGDTDKPKAKSAGRSTASTGRSDASRAVADALREQEKAQRDLDEQLRKTDDAQKSFTRTLEDLTAEMAGPLAQAELEHKRNVEELEKLARTGEVADRDLASAKAFLAQQHSIVAEKIAGERTEAERLIEDLRFEMEIMGLSNIEREKAIALRHANADATSAEGQAISSAIEQREAAREAQQYIDDLKTMTTDFAVSALSDLDNAGAAFEEFADRIKRMAIQMLAEKAIQWLMSMFMGGGMGGGTAPAAGSGAENTAFNNWYSGYGGGRAFGGPVKKNTLYEVGEGGMPEMLASGGKTFLIPGNDGAVIPSSRGMAASAGSGGGGMPNIEVRIMNNGRPVEQEGSSEITVEAGKMIVRLAVGEVTRQAARRGTPMNNAMRAGMATGSSLG